MIEDSSIENPHAVMLITGATGFIGSRLAAVAMTRGYEVKTLSRTDWDSTPAVPIRNRFLGSLPAQIPEEALRGVEIVVHCAATPQCGERNAYAVNVEGSVRLAQMAADAGVHTFVFLSSQSARPDALSAYGRTKYAAEERLREIKGLNIVVLRPGLVTGSGSRGLFQRMCGMVKTMPLIPLLGGGHSIVQPIHVDDLCTAIFRCHEIGDELKGSVLKLGDSQGLSLADFLQTIAVVQLGRRKHMLPIPLRPIEIGVKLLEALRIPLPINSNNLQGLKIVERMDTQADLDRLGLKLRSVNEAVRFTTPSKCDDIPLEMRAVRVMLVGTGRIGLIHAVTLFRSPGIKLVGMVDPKVGATRLLQKMGVTVPAYQSLEEALNKTKCDTAVIATPPATHLVLARQCLEQGVLTMIEKPLGIRREQLTDYERLQQEFSDQPVQVGYLMPRHPQIQVCVERLKQGEYGAVQGFSGLTLSSLIQGTGEKRWEVQKDKSGGGVLINAGGHLLSLIREVFGDPQSVKAQSVRIYSRDVEDSMVITFAYPEFSGSLCCSWAIDGYPRQDNRLIIRTDQGHLILTPSTGVFVPREGELDIVHALDIDVGFNMAPDSGGGAFAAEHQDLRHTALSRKPSQMDLGKALGVERLLFTVYKAADAVKAFSISMPGPQLSMSEPEPSPGAKTCRDVKLILDLRELSVTYVCSWLRGAIGQTGWHGYLLSPAQISALPEGLCSDARLRVSVPDFLNQSRLLSSGRYVEVLREMGIAGIVGAALSVPPVTLREGGITFWVAATGLLAAGLRSIPASFRGTILLNTFLTDIALCLRRLDMLERMLGLCRDVRPDARTGFHTCLASEALNALWFLETPVDEVSVLTSPGSPKMDTTIQEMRRASKQSRFTVTAEVGLCPDIVHREAHNTPQRWRFGADAILLGPSADPTLAAERQKQFRQYWAQAFPGLAMPEGVL